jgi:hypothetical protein
MLLDGNSISLFDCRLIRNSALIAGGAIYLEGHSGVGTATMLAERCVVAENSSRLGAALETSNAEVTLRSCTITRNVVTDPDFGAVLQIEGGIPVTVQVDRSIVAFNEGRALLCHAPGSEIIQCTDIFGNHDNSPCGSDGGGNLSIDPLFCDLLRGDYSLSTGSPCSADHSPLGCGLIGALGVVCMDPVLPSTWGNIKGHFMDRVHPSKSLK